MTIKQQGGVFGRNPTFNNVDIDGTGTVDGDLTVNGFSYFNDRLTVTDDHVRVIRSANTSRLEAGVDATSAYLKATYSSGGTRDLRFLSLNTEIARITANGLTFNGDTAAANALDDYEEGTWTVELYDADSSGNVSSTTTTGYYTKVGRVVHASFGPLNNIDTTGMTSGNTLRITLPFTPTQNSTGSVVVDTFTFGAGRTAINPVVLSGQSRARLFDTGGVVAFRSFPVSGITSGTSDIVRFSVTYIS